ncbi:MAG: hypothetical protein HOC74_28395 [Gemmatimonadetes bacterium]|nr:hypothetical protein [Gemmatimonadota bacterium]
MPFTITKSVRPNATWQEMYLQVGKGQRVIISADGLWPPEMRPSTIIWCGPAGIAGRLAGEDYLVPGTNVAALVARIGEETAPVAIGDYHDLVSPFEGPLFLAMNENPEYHNQAGEVKAQIILFEH